MTTAPLAAEPQAAEPATPSAAPETSDEERCSDLGNARRLVRLHGEDLRHVRAHRRWYFWDLRRWREDTTGEAERRAKAVIDTLYKLASATPDEKRRKTLAQHAIRSDNALRVRSLLELAATEPAIVLRPEQLDAGPWLLNTLNGTLDVRTGELRPHRRSDYLTKLAPIAYNPAATAPRFTAFLREIMGGDPELVAYVQRIVGYALTADTREQVFFIFHGTGANGKTTLVEVLRSLLGDYARQANFATFLARRDDAIRADLARLAGARLVTAVEAEEGQRFAESLVKQLVGGDVITARRLYREEVEFRPTFKLFLAANHKPAVWGTDLAFWRRVRLVPFTVTIPPERQDRELLRKLRDELPGVLAWAVQGCRQWLAHGLGEPPAVVAATRAYQAEQDLVGEFLDDRCQFSHNGRATVDRVERKALYVTYETWCRETGTPAISPKKFNERIRERGVRELKAHGGRWFWLGLDIKDATTTATTDTSDEDDDAF